MRLQGHRQAGAWGYIRKFLSAAFYYNTCVSLQCCFTIVVVSLSGLFHYRSCFTIRVISLVVVSLLWLFHFSSHHHGSTFYWLRLMEGLGAHYSINKDRDNVMKRERQRLLTTLFLCTYYSQLRHFVVHAKKL